MRYEGGGEKNGDKVSVFLWDWDHQNCLIRLLDSAQVYCPKDIKAEHIH